MEQLVEVEQLFNFQVSDNFREQLNSHVSALNFEKLKWKLTQSAEATWSSELCDFA